MIKISLECPISDKRVTVEDCRECDKYMGLADFKGQLPCVHCASRPDGSVKIIPACREIVSRPHKDIIDELVTLCWDVDTAIANRQLHIVSRRMIEDSKILMGILDVAE